jgi:hypothetical protein
MRRFIPRGDGTGGERRAHGSEPASMQCGGPVASPDTAMARHSEINQELIYGKNHRVLHTQQLPQEGRTGASGALWKSDRVRVVEEEISLSREVIARVCPNRGRERSKAMQPVNTAGLAIVFRNPEPRREPQYPNGWRLLTSDRQFNILVCHDDARRPRIVRKEAA